MRIDYCPKCNKAGLKYESQPHIPVWMSEEQAKVEIKRGLYSLEKWCPRCKEWVKPENHPYIGSRGIT